MVGREPHAVVGEPARPQRARERAVMRVRDVEIDRAERAAGRRASRSRCRSRRASRESSSARRRSTRSRPAPAGATLSRPLRRHRTLARPAWRARATASSAGHRSTISARAGARAARRNAQVPAGAAAELDDAGAARDRQPRDQLVAAMKQPFAEPVVVGGLRRVEALEALGVRAVARHPACSVASTRASAASCTVRSSCRDVEAGVGVDPVLALEPRGELALEPQCLEQRPAIRAGADVDRGEVGGVGVRAAEDRRARRGARARESRSIPRRAHRPVGAHPVHVIEQHELRDPLARPLQKLGDGGGMDGIASTSPRFSARSSRRRRYSGQQLAVYAPRT